MNWKFKLSKRLAISKVAMLFSVAAISACAADKSLTDPAAPSSHPTTDTTTVPSQPVTPPSGSVSHAGYFVTPGGTSAGTGSAASPWDLRTALAGGNGKVQPGDTVWIKSGTYTGSFRATASGVAGRDVVFRQYPGDHAIIDGAGTPGGAQSVWYVGGQYSEFWDFEITNSDAGRTTSSTANNVRPNVVANYASHTKYINLVVHDGGVAFYNEPSEGDVQITGCLVYNNGWQGPDRGHGHALYLKSDGGQVTASENILFDQFGYGVHLYSDAGSGANSNMHIVGNVSFNNGTVANNSSSANILMGGENVSTGDVFTDNMTYITPGKGGTNVEFGYQSVVNGSLTVNNNYFAGGSTVMTMGFWNSVSMSNNTLIGTSQMAVSSDPARTLGAGLTELTSLPGATKVFVRASPVASGRGNIVVYNWGGQGSVTADISGIVPAGQHFEIHNAQDFYGAPVASGTGGGSVTLSMSGVTPPSVIGMGALAPSTGSQFAVFVVTTS